MNTVNDELLEKKFLEIATLVYSEISGNEANETRAISRFKDGNRVVETIKDCSLWQAIDITDFYNKNEKTILEVLKLFVDGGILKIPNLSDKNGPIANPSLAYPGVASHDLLPRLLSPVHYTIEKNCDYSFNQTELISAYRKYYDGWKNKSFLIHIICPLHGVSEVFSEFEIGGFRVVKFDDSLKELVWNHGTQGSNRESTREFCDLQYALYKQKTVGHSDRAMVDDVGKIISSMRLAKEGLIYAANIYEIPELWHRVGGGRHPLSEFDYPVFFINTNEYQLNSQDETDSLLSVYNLLHANRRTEIDFALRRFNLSYSRAHLEDQIIDLVICLECLLLHGKKDELKYRLSLNLLCLLGYNKHFCLKQFVNQIYDLRSSIVHDGAQISTYKHIKKFQKLFGVDDGRWIGLVESKLRDVVRQAILKVLEHIKAGGTMSSLNEKLEEKLLQSL